jgi:hypothetical protein
MNLSVRVLAVTLGVVGMAMGVSFGAGVAYGRGEPKTVQSGLTQQQIQQLYGAPTNPGATQGGTGTGLPGAGGLPSTPSAGSGGAAPASARGTSGRVTNISGQTLTIETARGSEKVNLSPSGTVSKSTPGVISDIKEGTNVFASGNRNADGSLDATSLSEISAEQLQFLSSLTSLPVTPSGTPGRR